MEIRTPYITFDTAALGSATAPSAASTRAAAQPGSTGGAIPLADSSELSSAARAIAAAAQLPEVRQERVDALQQQIASGTYQVQPQDVADAVLRQFRG
jgi:flagellar biosynthesis anti-sigma factor FlgM